MAIDSTSVKALAETWGTVPAELRVRLRPALRAAGQLIANQARANASWSDRIPGAIGVTTSFSSRGGVKVRVSATKAPHARALEGVTRDNTFRHPVFGKDVWVEQPTRPFLFPAVRAKRNQAMEAISAAIMAATKART